jgi:20S proteasome alpha/beta subunit
MATSRLPIIPRRLFRPYTHRHKVVKKADAMTLAVSIRTNEGVIICSESQITDGASKHNEPKITSTIMTPELKLAVAGAGWWDYVQMAYSELNKSVLNAEQNADVKDIITSVVTALYDNQIRAYPNEYDKPRISLLAVAIRKGGSPAIIKAVDTAVHDAKPFDAIGIGQDLARYLGSKLFHPLLSADHAGALAAYILEEAKANVEGCGGKSQVLWLDSNGLKYLPTAHLMALRAWFARNWRGLPDFSKMPSTIPTPLLLPVVQT